MLKDKIDVLVYASPTSHICWLDTLLASLSDIVTVDMHDKVYLNMFGENIDEKTKIIDELQKENMILRQQQESPRLMWKCFWRSLKNRMLRW